MFLEEMPPYIIVPMESLSAFMAHVTARGHSNDIGIFGALDSTVLAETLQNSDEFWVQTIHSQGPHTERFSSEENEF